MGDPGVAKSQLLSYIDRLAPRSEYSPVCQSKRLVSGLIFYPVRPFLSISAYVVNINFRGDGLTEREQSKGCLFLINAPI